MDVEIIEFFPNIFDEEKGYLSGTLRIRIPDLKIHILGVTAVRKNQNTWFFFLPGRNATDYKTGEKVRHPIIAFEDRNLQKELLAAIREKAPPFIEKRLADKENPLIFPLKEQNNSRHAGQPKASDKTLEPKKEAPIASANPKSTIFTKVWQVPPKRIQKHLNVRYTKKFEKGEIYGRN